MEQLDKSRKSERRMKTCKDCSKGAYCINVSRKYPCKHFVERIIGYKQEENNRNKDKRSTHIFNKKRR